MSSIKIKRPLGDRLVVERDEAASQTPSGFIIPEVAKDRPHTGVVVVQGPEVKERLEGARVIFGKYSGTEFGQLVLLRESEVFAIIE